MKLPEEGIVDVARLSRIYDNTVATYKFYWFISIINHLVANPEKRLFSFDEIIAGMIAEAWYPIHFFRISFGILSGIRGVPVLVEFREVQQLLSIQDLHSKVFNDEKKQPRLSGRRTWRPWSRCVTSAWPPGVYSC